MKLPTKEGYDLDTVRNEQVFSGSPAGTLAINLGGLACLEGCIVGMTAVGAATQGNSLVVAGGVAVAALSSVFFGMVYRNLSLDLHINVLRERMLFVGYGTDMEPIYEQPSRETREAVKAKCRQRRKEFPYLKAPEVTGLLGSHRKRMAAFVGAALIAGWLGYQGGSMYRLATSPAQTPATMVQENSLGR